MEGQALVHLVDVVPVHQPTGELLRDATASCRRREPAVVVGLEHAPVEQLEEQGPRDEGVEVEPLGLVDRQMRSRAAAEPDPAAVGLVVFEPCVVMPMSSSFGRVAERRFRPGLPQTASKGPAGGR